MQFPTHLPDTIRVKVIPGSVSYTHLDVYKRQLDIFTRKVEQFVGNYHDAVEQVERKIEAQNRENARLEKEIQANKDQANVFAHK